MWIMVSSGWNSYKGGSATGATMSSKPRAGGVAVAQPADQRAGGGSIPTPALLSLRVRPIPIAVAKVLIVRYHYLHSLPGGTSLAFGVFLGNRLLGALTLGVGPLNAYSLVAGARPEDCLVLTRQSSEIGRAHV